MMSHLYRRCSKCGANQASHPGLRMHKFPALAKNNANIHQLMSWAMFCFPTEDWSAVDAIKGLQVSSKVVCNKHFADSEYRSSERIYLNKGALPSIDEEKNFFHFYRPGPSHVQNHSILRLTQGDRICHACLCRANRLPAVLNRIQERIDADLATQEAAIDEEFIPSSAEQSSGGHSRDLLASANPSVQSVKQDETNQGDDDSEQINNETAISDIDTAPNAADESDNEIEEEMEVWAESARVLVCAECGRAADCGGKLYQCVECPRIVCAACEREERHRQHCLLRLPSRAVYDKLRVLYESLRETVTAHLCDDDELLVPKEEPLLKPEPLLEPDPLNATSNAIGNSKRLIVNAPSLVESGPELILIPGARSVPATISVPASKSVHAPKSVPAPISVPAAKSVRAPNSVPKFIFQARVSKPKSVPDSKSDERQLMSNLPGDHGHSYTVISTGAAKWTGTTRPTSSTERCEPTTTTAKRKKPERQKDDEEPVYMDVEYLMTDEEE